MLAARCMNLQTSPVSQSISTKIYDALSRILVNGLDNLAQTRGLKTNALMYGCDHF